MIIITLSGLLELPYSFFNICSLKHEQQNSISHFTQVLRNKVLARESPLIEKKNISVPPFICCVSGIMGSGLRSANCEKPVPITEKTIVALMICVVTQ